MPKKLLFLFITLLVFKSNAQQEELILLNTVPLKLISNANAIVRHDDETVTLLKLNKMNYSRNRIVTVLNSSGDTKHGAVIHYDKNIVVKKMTARIYNSKGKEIKKIKKNDFEDISAVQGGTLYSDSRVKYLNYIPTEYPYTIHFEAEIEYNSTAFIPHWTPIDNYYTSVQNSSYKIINLSPTEVNTKASNFEEYAIEEVGEHGYMAQNLPAIEPEAYSPSFANVVPSLKVSLTQFEMEGVRGVNTNWEDFGNWMYEALIKNTQELPEDVITEVNQLTQGAKNDIEKAKIIYKYVQEKTRYISVQVGIGGWKPMPASDVHKLGYGDCKGLTNYTKTLLKQVGVESYYTVIYGGREIKNIDATFSSIQGNHVILCLPLEEEYLWLEC